jgi:hypothetical protein
MQVSYTTLKPFWSASDCAWTFAIASRASHKSTKAQMKGVCSDVNMHFPPKSAPVNRLECRRFCAAIPLYNIVGDYHVHAVSGYLYSAIKG